jgi:hypothetical protein
MMWTGGCGKVHQPVVPDWSNHLEVLYNAGSTHVAGWFVTPKFT